MKRVMECFRYYLLRNETLLCNMAPSKTIIVVRFFPQFNRFAHRCSHNYHAYAHLSKRSVAYTTHDMASVGVVIKEETIGNA